jgi:hypothetical protein
MEVWGLLLRAVWTERWPQTNFECFEKRIRNSDLGKRQTLPVKKCVIKKGLLWEKWLIRSIEIWDLRKKDILEVVSSLRNYEIKGSEYN